MRVIRVLAIFGLLVGFLCTKSSLADSGANTRLEPLVRIIATPSRFEGQTIAVIGFLVFQAQERVLYVTREDALHSILPNGLGFDISEKHGKYSALADLNGKYVMIVGTFRAPLPESQRFTSGRITDVVEVYGETAWGRDAASPFAPR